MTENITGTVRSPILKDARRAFRDPALYYHDGEYHLFFTVVEQREEGYYLYIGTSKSSDLLAWEPVRQLTTSELHFSSPGNLIFHNRKWIMCVQSYPIKRGEDYGDERCRLWLMESEDLYHWSEPRAMEERGCRANWTSSSRQIDPYLIEHRQHYYCFYKTDGHFGAIVSDDLHQWREASPEQPVLSREQTPDRSSVENPCIIHDGSKFVLFFAPCRQGRGIGIAYSHNLLQWTDIRYLPFPSLDWAPGGPTAAMVLDQRAVCGKWLMAFHGDIEGPHGGAIGLAWSEDLIHWHVL